MPYGTKYSDGVLLWKVKAFFGKIERSWVPRSRNGPRAVVLLSTPFPLDRSLGAPGVIPSTPGSAISVPHAEEAFRIGFDQHRLGRIGSAPSRWTTAACPGYSAVDHRGHAARSRPPELAFRHPDSKKSSADFIMGTRIQEFDGRIWKTRVSG
jgi:hypothetical protein